MAMSDGHELRYVRPPVPLVFPSEQEVPETKRHLKLRTLLFELLELAFAERAAIGCDQFVYWDPTDPKACLAPDAFVRLGQPDFLFRSLANLVRNAVRYAGHAGPIQVSASSLGHDVSIRVSDQGPGVPDAEIEEIFKPFYRPEFARQRETGGTGLGLAIVKSCIEACGGIVRCRNRSPQGLEVEIRLPAPAN